MGSFAFVRFFFSFSVADPSVQESNPVIISCLESLLRRKSNFTSIMRIVSYVLRYAGRSRKKADKFNPAISSLPSASEMQDAKDLLIRDCQRRHFQEEITVYTEGTVKKRKIKRVLNR